MDSPKDRLKERESRYSLKDNEKECRERHRAFWQNESLGSPLIFAIADRPDYQPEPWPTTAARKDWDLLPDWHLNMVRNYLSGTVFLADAMPVASLMVGLDITNSAVLAGGDYDYSSTQHCIDYQPGRFNLYEPIPAFQPDNNLVAGLKQCYDAVIEYVGSQACVNTPMTLDALSSIYSLSNSMAFLTDLLRIPQIIKKRVEELTTVYLQFFDYFYELLLERGYGESSSWFQVFAEGKFESVRCDFSVMLSEKIFRELVIPELDQVCSHMDYSLFNMCSVKHARFIDALSELEALDGIFWNPEPDRNGVKGHLSTLKYIKQKGMCLEIVCQSVDEAVFATRELGPDGLYIFFENKFTNIEEAEVAVGKIYKACKG